MIEIPGDFGDYEKLEACVLGSDGKVYTPSEWAALRARQAEYRPPVDKICPACGAKHTGPWNLCSSCKAAWDRGL